MLTSLIALGFAVAARLVYKGEDPLPGSTSGEFSQVEEFFIRAT